MKVVVLDPLACFRCGLVAQLSIAGFAPFEPTDVEGWVRSGEPGAVVVTLLGDVEAKWLIGLRESAPAVPALALLSKVTVDDYRLAMRSGATSAIGRDAPPEDIVESLSAACAGRAIMPSHIAAALATAVDAPDHLGLSTTEVRWLSALSEGLTVADLAREAGYSEREMFRRLANIYAHMGVSGRTEALLAAQRLGLV